MSVPYNKSFSLNSQVIYIDAKICNFNLKHLKILIGFICIKKIEYSMKFLFKLFVESMFNKTLFCIDNHKL